MCVGFRYTDVLAGYSSGAQKLESNQRLGVGPLRCDPTPAFERWMNSLLLSLKRESRLSPQLYRHLHSSAGKIPLLYGLPKLHKPGVPLRPIVSFVNSPSYNLSKYLVHLLSPLVGSSSSHVRNSEDFARFARDLHLRDDDLLVSYDVVLLFTNVPVELACRVARERLQLDLDLADRTSLTVDEVISLLEFCLSATYLAFRGAFYQQVFGTAMGSPVSVTVANLVMEDMEARALSMFTPPPLFWKRYVDDTCCALP